MTQPELLQEGQSMPVPAGVSRRKFLGYAGLSGGILAALSACSKSKDDNGFNTGAYMGSGDIGILNYAYALEQLEAAFYAQVVLTTYSGITALETSLLTDIRDHEIAHREFFKAALGTNALPALQVDFSSVNFGSRDSVLGTAKVFEDLGVSAYNGAGRLIKNPAYLELAGKIVSVEARHAAYIRDLLSNGSFADSTVVDVNGLDLSRKPIEVLTMAKPFIKTALNAKDLPSY
jgi:hypothetical protein